MYGGGDAVDVADDGGFLVGRERGARGRGAQDVHERLDGADEVGVFILEVVLSEECISFIFYI